MIRILMFLIMLAVTTVIHPADKDGNYAVWGPGEKSCHSYNKAREAGSFDDYKYFIMGYLTAYNTLTDETYRASGNKDFPKILEWLDNYCQPKGLHSFEQAVGNFIIEHHEERLTRPVSRFGR